MHICRFSGKILPQMDIRIKEDKIRIINYYNKGRIFRHEDFIEVKFYGEERSLIAHSLSNAIEKIAKYIKTKGRVIPEDQRIKKINKSRYNRFAVMQIDKYSDEFIQEFKSAREAALSLDKKNDEPIKRVCRNYINQNGGHYYSAYGYKWEYKHNYKR